MNKEGKQTQGLFPSQLLRAGLCLSARGGPLQAERWPAAKVLSEGRFRASHTVLGRKTIHVLE